MAVHEYIPKCFGERPPIDPPSATSFDSNGDDNDLVQWYKDQLRSMERLAKNPELDIFDAQEVRQLVRQRCNWLKGDLTMFAVIDPIALPPGIACLHSMDEILESTKPEKQLKSILASFEDIERDLEGRMYDIKGLYF